MGHWGFVFAGVRRGETASAGGLALYFRFKLKTVIVLSTKQGT